MKLKIGSRKSDLARIQAYAVASALKDLNPSLDFEFVFKSSLGDQNASDPLWKMPEKGVFTQDLTKDLIEERVDCVVHSWKDLPASENSDTVIAATLERASRQDCLLLKNSFVGGDLIILSSSPRRAYQMEKLRGGYLPWNIGTIRTEPVRGNVQTRIEKFLLSPAHGLLMAKAALDRMQCIVKSESEVSANFYRFLNQDEQLQSTIPKWKKLGKALRDQVRPIVLPLQVFPTAAAQGAIAIEVKSDDLRVLEMMKAINHKRTWNEVEEERKILKHYGGGCHQAIGVSVMKTISLTRTVVVGKLDPQDEIEDFHRKKNKEIATLEYQTTSKLPEHINFTNAKQIITKTREKLVQSHLYKRESSDPALHWLSRKEALPETEVRTKLVLCKDFVVTPGLTTWKAIGQSGVVVNACAEGFGEQELASLIPELFLNHKHQTFLWTHSGVTKQTSNTRLGTYRVLRELKLPVKAPDHTKATLLFVSSPQDLEYILHEIPEAKSWWIAYPPGKTADFVTSVIPESKRVAVWNEEHFRRLKALHERSYRNKDTAD